MKFDTQGRNTIALIVSLVGLVPTGLLALWAIAQNGEFYETTIKTEYAKCPTVADCRVPQQCRINVEALKRQYVKDLDGSQWILYKLAGYPTISVGYPVGSEDSFLIPVCKP